MKVQYDESQRAVIECEDDKICAEAKAGAGKTTTAIGFAARRPDEKFIYLCLNKAMQLDAQRRFGPNVECRTTHSVAFGSVGRFFANRVTAKWGARLIADEMGERSPRVAAAARAALLKFFGDTERDVQEHHIQDIQTDWQLYGPEPDRALELARKVWRKMQDTNANVSLCHDAYLKMWALTEPQFQHQRVVLDEGRDTNPIIAQVIRSQKRAKVLVLGDRHQGIYLFRGSLNFMREFAESGATVIDLPRTWRFGDRTATIANEILGRLKGETTKIIGMGKDEPAPKRGGRFAFLSRTNSVLFGVAAQRRGKSVHWVGGIQNYRIEAVEDAYRLYSGQLGAIRDSIIRRYQSWGQYEEEMEATKDAEARILVKIVQQFRHEIPQLVQELRDNEERDPERAEVVLSTAHKMKGLDADHVVIGDDFECLFDAEEQLDGGGVLTPEMEQEINLLYVAVTRARKSVRLNLETKDWFEQNGILLPGDAVPA